MEFYKIDANWAEVEQILDTALKHANQQEVCFAWEDGNVYMSTTNQSYINIIKRQYELEVCENPNSFFDSRNWHIIGNRDLFASTN